MARRSAPQEEYYDEQDEMLDGPPEEGQQEQSETLKSAPYFAISLAFNAIVLLLIWSIEVAGAREPESAPMPTALETRELPDPPKITPETVTEVDRPEDPEVDPVEDPQIVEEAVDDRNEDPTETDAQELRPSEVQSDNPIDAPNPAQGFNPAIGLGGNFGGGGGPGGGMGGRELRRSRGGGGESNERHVLAALRWLRDHQKVDGGWHPIDFPSDGARNDRRGDYANANGTPSVGFDHVEAGLTGLATLAFLGAGFTHLDGEFKRTVHRALGYMRGIQDNDGAFGGLNSREHESFMYNHALCAMAMAEAFGMTNSIALKGPAQRGVDFIALAQNVDQDRGYTGWRYGVRPGVSDTSVTGWCALALKSAKMAGLDVPDHCWEGSIKLLDEMTGPIRTGFGMGGGPSSGGETNYRTGYLTRAGFNARLMGYEGRFETNHSMSSINIITRFFVEGDGSRLRRDATLINLANQIVADPPTLSNPSKLDYYYWYYASLAIFQMGGNHWDRWRRPMNESVINSQIMSGTETDAKYGSWDSHSAWGPAGGRVYATAINCLTLEVYYRYERIDEGR